MGAPSPPSFVTADCSVVNEVQESLNNFAFPYDHQDVDHLLFGSLLIPQIQPAFLRIHCLHFSVDDVQQNVTHMEYQEDVAVDAAQLDVSLNNIDNLCLIIFTKILS